MYVVRGPFMYTSGESPRCQESVAIAVAKIMYERCYTQAQLKQWDQGVELDFRADVV